MPKPDNQWQELARDAAKRIDQQHQMGEQLALLPDEMPEPSDTGDEGKSVGRPKGAKNKVSSQLRDYLVARGCRLPEDVLIEVAGLNTRHDLVSLAMRQTERVLSWAFNDAHIGEKSATKATPGMRLEVFRQQYTMILRAAEALLPYMAPKATPDINVSQNTTFIVPAQPAAPAPDPGQQARDVTPQRPAQGVRMMPADMRHEIEQKQTLSETETQHSDAEIRTDKASD